MAQSVVAIVFEEGDAPGKAGSAAAEEKPAEKTEETKTAGGRSTRGRKP